MTVQPKKVLIAGAGVVGLLTAQALRARGIECVVFDRDINAEFRESAGWAITLHWALPTFLSLLPADIAVEVYAAQVRPGFHAADTGTFRYINASSGETVVSIPPAPRLRVRREQIRRTLLVGVDVQWDCRLSDISADDSGVEVTCCTSSGPRKFRGDVLLACDGANSTARRVLCGDAAGALHQLPVRFCGAKVRILEAEAADIAARFDPLLFQGTVPATGTFFWFLMLATPEYTGEPGVCYAQVNLSWRCDPDDAAAEPFSTDAERAAALLKRADGLHPDLHALVERAAADPAQLVEIRLADWPEVLWDTHGGRVLLMGDAAHAMTMYRGEAANHGITDAAELVAQMDAYSQGRTSWTDAAATYCAGVKARAGEAVLLSRQACLDAHDMAQIRPDLTSPLLLMRRKTGK